MEELRMKDLYIGKVVNSRQIRKFHNYAIVLGDTKESEDEKGRPVIEGKIVFVGKTLDDFYYERSDGEETYVKPPSAKICSMTVDAEEEEYYEQLFGDRAGAK